MICQKIIEFVAGGHKHHCPGYSDYGDGGVSRSHDLSQKKKAELHADEVQPRPAREHEVVGSGSSVLPFFEIFLLPIVLLPVVLDISISRFSISPCRVCVSHRTYLIAIHFILFSTFRI